MLALKIAALCVAALSTIVVGFFVLTRSERTANSQAFFWLALGMAGWALGIAAFLGTENIDQAYFDARVYYIFPLLIAIALTTFVQTFAGQRPARGWIPAAWGGGLALIAVIVFRPELMLGAITYHDWGKAVVLHGQMYAIYSVYLLVFYLAALAFMYRYSRALRGIYALQAQAFFVGFLITFIFGVGFNLILPAIDHYEFIYLGPLFISTFMVFIAYSIVKHRMFDVRMVVVRTFTYAVSLAVLAVLYGFVVFGLLRFVFDLQLTLGAQILVSVTTALAAIGFNPLKNFFDRISNRLFYRDAYDAAELLDGLNRLFVTNTDPERLMRGAANMMAESLHAEFVFFNIKASNAQPQRNIGSGTNQLNPETFDALAAEVPHIRRKTIVADDLGDSHENLRTLLRTDDVAVIGRLTPAVTRTTDDMGFLILGSRRSGNPYTPADLRTLEIIVNELVIAIENSLRFEEIQHFNQTLQQNVGEATRKLRRSNEKLQALDATKDDFITMASHQLRTPLTSVKGYLSMVLEGDVGKLNAQQRQLLTQSYLSSQRMVYLISDLLNLSRLNTGKFVIDLNPVDLAEIVQSELDQLYETARAREVALTYDRPSGIPRLMLDETKIRQVVMNLIDNAIYYTPAGGSIQVEVRATKSAVEFRVVDDGIGVPRAVQHRLFTKFYRAENAQAARPDGTGLGLFMAKKVVVAQGGAIIFSSEEGKGSIFGFRFSIRDHVVEK